MVAGKTDIGSSQTLMTALAVPRPLSRIFLNLVFLAIGQAAWVWLDVKLLAFISGQAVAVCTLCLAAVWSLREKAADVFSDNDLSSEDLRMVQKAARQLGTKSIKRAIWVGICVLLAGGPAASNQLSGFVMQWMVIFGALGVAESLYALWLTSHLSEQIQDWRDTKKVEIREAIEKRAQLERLQNSMAVAGWQPDDSGKTVTGELRPLH